MIGPFTYLMMKQMQVSREPWNGTLLFPLNRKVTISFVVCACDGLQSFLHARKKALVPVTVRAVHSWMENIKF
jgi:hypothetical protein